MTPEVQALNDYTRARVMRLIGAGETPARIAKRVGVEENTVRMLRADRNAEKAARRAAALAERQAERAARREAIAERKREALERKRAKQSEFDNSTEPFAKTGGDFDTEKQEERALAKWLALPIRYENHPELPWNAGAAARNDAHLARRRSHFRTLGGVADYSSVPEAA